MSDIQDEAYSEAMDELAEKDAEIAAYKEQQTEDINALRECHAQIKRLKSLLTRAADALDWWARHRSYDPAFAVELKKELRKAAE